MIESNVRSRLALSECRREARAGVQEQLAASGRFVEAAGGPEQLSEPEGAKKSKAPTTLVIGAFQ